ncbi:MAG: hypothetical protein HOM66_06270 [Rhodospirillales bacterium]|nr:hypothetical protein [Rhodospirillales bacterium]
MKTYILFFVMCGVIFPHDANAGLCKSMRDLKSTTKTKNDVNFFQKLFPHPFFYGNRTWNEVIVQCNRFRDRKGGQVSKFTAARGGNSGKSILKSRTLKAKVIRGKYNFLGTAFTQQKYIYVISKKDGVWEMVVPYRPIINDFVKNRVDFNAAHAWKLYTRSEVTPVPGGAGVYTLNSPATPLWLKVCKTSIYFPGFEGKYAGKGLYTRDPQNKFISSGKIEYQYTKKGNPKSGCRVSSDMDLFWLDPIKKQIVKVKPKVWVLDNFVRTAEAYWNISDDLGNEIFRLKLLMKGHNEGEFKGSPALKLFKKNDHLTVRFATKFLPYKFNQMYKSNPVQFNNFSTMTTDNTYWHEVGHAFGLDDEYGGGSAAKGFKRNGCEATKYRAHGSMNYQMCAHNVTDKRLIYHYLAVSRYLQK